jgi:hypothetical protein
MWPSSSVLKIRPSKKIKLSTHEVEIAACFMLVYDGNTFVETTTDFESILGDGPPQELTHSMQITYTTGCSAVTSSALDIYSKTLCDIFCLLYAADRFPLSLNAQYMLIKE